MESFTFVSICYNHEKYIIEHLESIRYQIENYATNISVHYILADDGSTDDTVFLARKWISQYEHIFSSVMILDSKINVGIVKNYEKALMQIKTEHFKIMAGDDMFYKESIFAAAELGDFVICPVLPFDEHNCFVDMYSLKWWTLKEVLACKESDRKRKILKRMKYKNCIVAPGVIWNSKFIDEKLLSLLDNFKWIEDYPTWMYILHQKDLIPKTSNRPIALYRMSTGVSKKHTNSSKKKEFDRELRAQYTFFNSVFSKIPRAINLRGFAYYFMYICKAFIFKYVVDKKNINLIELNNCLRSADENIKSFVDYLNGEASVWYQTNEIEKKE